MAGTKGSHYRDRGEALVGLGRFSRPTTSNRTLHRTVRISICLVPPGATLQARFRGRKDFLVLEVESADTHQPTLAQLETVAVVDGLRLTGRETVNRGVGTRLVVT